MIESLIHTKLQLNFDRKYEKAPKNKIQLAANCKALAPF